MSSRKRMTIPWKVQKQPVTVSHRVFTPGEWSEKWECNMQTGLNQRQC